MAGVSRYHIEKVTRDGAVTYYVVENGKSYPHSASIFGRATLRGARRKMRRLEKIPPYPGGYTVEVVE